MHRNTLVVCGFAILVASCVESNKYSESARVDTVTTESKTPQRTTSLPRYAPAGCPVYSHDVGVYYFDCVKGTFARGLARFKKDKPDLVVTAMAGDGTGGQGSDFGYFVSTEQRTTIAAK